MGSAGHGALEHDVITRITAPLDGDLRGVDEDTVANEQIQVGVDIAIAQAMMGSNAVVTKTMSIFIEQWL